MSNDEKSSNVPPKRSMAENRADALVLLGEGHSVTEVSKTLGVRWNTVGDWRDSPEGQDHIAKARQARHKIIIRKSRDALTLLADNSILAAQTLVDLMSTSFDDKVRRAAALDILDRCGAPALKTQEQREELERDLSKLSDDEIDQLDKLHQKATGHVS
jgi:transposase